MILYCYYHYRELEQLASVRSENEYLSLCFDIPYVVVRALLDVGTMFYGRGNTDVLNLHEFQNPFFILMFWLFQVIAFLTTASALLIRYGNDFIRWIRKTKTKFSNVDLIFGINQDSLAFGRNISPEKGKMLVYVDSVIGEDYEAAIRDLGGISYSDKEAIKATASFLNDIRIEPQKTKLRLYALSGEYDKNLQYAQMMSESLQKKGIAPEQTELILLGTDEWKGMFFQSDDKQYGYGSVVSFDEFEMSARLLVHEYPLCNAINFDKNGRATEDMSVLIVGFGRIGHEVLRKVIANGQFEGSKFHVTIYDPNFEHRTGFFKSQYPTMFANYNIDFEPQSGRGNKIFKFLQDNASHLKYIVVCLKDRETARDIAIDMVDRLQTMGYSQNVYTCDAKSVRCYSQYANECKTHWIYDSELLYSGELDKYAMELNHSYAKGQDLYEDWKQCDYFGRMSSRASVDYLIPFIRRIKQDKDNLTYKQRENLARSEHLRWCAFHYTFGYDVMEKEEFVKRVKDYLNEIREYGKSKIKLTKDSKAMKHVCLVEWNKLDEISRIENSLTHGNRNYKDSDRSNVDMVMNLIKGQIFLKV